jgi:Ca2+:H+ antiporter
VKALPVALKPLHVLLLVVPVALAANWWHWSPLVIFAASALALVPLAQILGDATEELAAYTGPRIGGLLNATLGNAAELIIAGFALRAGLLELVKASITGSIMGNLLLVLGAALCAGGLRHGIQRFDRTEAGISVTMMVLAVVALMVPAVYGHLLPQVRNSGPVEQLSIAVAVVMILVYLLALYYSHVWNAGGHGHDAHTATWSRRTALGVLLVTTLGVILMSEILVGAVEPVVQQFGVTELFLGIVLVPIVGNVAEHLVAVEAAIKNKMDLSLAIALGSSTQVAMFVAPVLVLASLVVGHPMDLIFTEIELVGLAAASLVAALIALDGESNWLEGVMLLAVYLVFALAFWWWPVPGL